MRRRVTAGGYVAVLCGQRDLRVVATPSGGDDGSSGNGKCPYDPTDDYAFVYASQSTPGCYTSHARTAQAAIVLQLCQEPTRLSSLLSTKPTRRIFLNPFYRAMLCIRGTSHGPVSVCLCPSVSVRVCHKSEFY